MDVLEGFRAYLTQDGGKLMAEIRANRNALEQCPRHDFESTNPPYEIGQKFKCRECKGLMPAIEALAYARGYQAAGGDPNKIIEGFI